jgi:hypothetical protein
MTTSGGVGGAVPKKDELCAIAYQVTRRVRAQIAQKRKSTWKVRVNFCQGPPFGTL